MELREITKDMIKAALSNPEQIGKGYNHKKLAFKTFEGKKMKVVYTKEEDKYIIISAIWE